MNTPQTYKEQVQVAFEHLQNPSDEDRQNLLDLALTLSNSHTNSQSLVKKAYPTPTHALILKSNQDLINMAVAAALEIERLQEREHELPLTDKEKAILQGVTAVLSAVRQDINARVSDISIDQILEDVKRMLNENHTQKLGNS